MRVTLLYSEDCPSWRVVEGRLEEALRLSGHAGVRVEHVLVSSDEQARELRFVGSPTVLINGVDPFLDEQTRPHGLACRVYRTSAGLGGSPSLDQLLAAIAAHT